MPQCHGPELTEEAVHEALAASLKRLGTSYVDLYYLHRLPDNRDVKVFMTAAKAAVEAGKINAWHAIHPMRHAAPGMLDFRRLVLKRSERLMLSTR
eukprot:scaffold42937_cov45-Prasinocladus_malaysianus.AAC.1